tara:strand:+ start:179 stop:994 length:816 start_codon:yes stop_codon:yes gene_type:complete
MKISMYCLSLDPNHLEKIKYLKYIPVGLGDNSFNKNWLNDKHGTNISRKNPFYGEYTFHYWIWKNHLKNLEKGWIGFCQYRKFWTQNEIKKNISSIADLNHSILKEIPESYLKYDSIIGEPFYVNQFRFTKFIKRNLKKMILNPKFFLKKNRTIKFHFDMWHGEGNIDRAISLLDKNDRSDFNEFINSKQYFNPHNMFMCKNKDVLTKYYESVIPWLERCETHFGFNNLKGFGLKRIYGFLAERYLSYWFQKNTNFKTMPIYFKDISNLSL